MSTHEEKHREKPDEHKELGENPIISRIKRQPFLTEFVIFIVIAAVVGGYLYWQDLQSKIYIEKAEISAQVISLSSPFAGTIEKFYVTEGDRVANGQRLAVVGNQTVYARTNGLIIWIKNAPGQMTGPQDPIVKMIDTDAMRVVGRVQEDKGLKDVRPGQHVIFIVDAFGDKKYEGFVDTVGMSARQEDIVFSISDKRESREFEVTALFDTQAYPELKNGMSAKMWIVK
ncbi:MAG: HlyD family efflux transporter periplasmic adaptor subunit [Candidatus ainarchaeum sp.]|nr:HlyD family efflux transporter periplasmic adaptor subunit [Candidatus ainarchaeum sp.]